MSSNRVVGDVPSGEVVVSDMDERASVVYPLGTGGRHRTRRPDAQRGCGHADAFAAATAAVSKAEDTRAPWTGPTTGPRAAAGKTIVYVAQTMTNPGVAGVAKGAAEAAAAIGWDVQTIDGESTPAGIQAAFQQAIERARTA